MIKPDFRVTIAYGSPRTQEVAEALEKEMRRLQDQGYPIEPQLVLNNAPQIHEAVHKHFSDFDFAVFLLDARQDDQGNPYLSPNLFYEISLAIQANKRGILWTSFTDIETLTTATQRLSDYRALLNNAMLLMDGKTVEQCLREILEHLHRNIATTLTEQSYDYLGDTYDATVQSVLSEQGYYSQLSSIAKSKTVTIPTKVSFSAYTSPFGAFLSEEYGRFPTMSRAKQTFYRRVQYLADRILFFVYLRDDGFLAGAIANLEKQIDAVFKPEERSFPQQSVSVLRRVATYHGRMEGDQTTFHTIRTELEDALNVFAPRGAKPVANAMLQCLAFDYLGLTEHKLAGEKLAVAIGEGRFFAENPAHIQKLRDTRNNPAATQEAIRLLVSAVGHFDDVIKLVTDAMEADFIWRGYARYNKARCQYLLDVLGNDYGQTWERSLSESVLEREGYAKRYELLVQKQSFPAVIAYNLRAEHYHAALEKLCYRHTRGDDVQSAYNKLKAEIDAWKAKSAFYGDTLAVSGKQERLENRLNA